MVLLVRVLRMRIHPHARSANLSSRAHYLDYPHGRPAVTRVYGSHNDQLRTSIRRRGSRPGTSPDSSRRPRPRDDRLVAAAIDRMDKGRDLVWPLAKAVTGRRQRIESARREGIMGLGWIKHRASLRRAGCLLWVATVAPFSAVAAPSASLASTTHVPVLGSRAFIPRDGVGWGS